MAIIYLIGAFVMNASANVLLKIAASKGVVLSGGFSHILWENRFIFISLCLFGLNLVLYFLALRLVPISVAYPIMIGMTFVITVSVSLFLGEHISALHWTGLALILAGLLIVARFAA